MVEAELHQSDGYAGALAQVALTKNKSARPTGSGSSAAGSTTGCRRWRRAASS